MKRFSKVLRPDSKVLIIIDDISRPTQAHLLFTPFLEEIHAPGIKIMYVKPLIAVRTYYPVTAEEIICKAGWEGAQKYLIMNHEWDNPEVLHNYGLLEDGTKIILNK